MEIYTGKKSWIGAMKSNSDYKKLRFKWLVKDNNQSVQLPFEIEDDLIDYVEIDEFIRIEEQRIPIFLGCQFGLFSHLWGIPNFFNGKRNMLF